jgi:tetratricopeptide (TPR) repeat protein
VAAQLALQVARAYYLSIGDAESAITWFDRAVVLAEALEDLPLLATTFASYAGAFVLVGRTRMGLGLLRVSLDLARQLDAPQIRLRPLNNLVSFLATRDLNAAREYAEEGLALVRRFGDREWGVNMIASAIHVYWNSGEWDTALELSRELEGMSEHSPVQALIRAYVRSITEARGLPAPPSTASNRVPGMRADLMVEAAMDLNAAADARARDDRDTASTESAGATEKFVQTSAIDDDFPIFWVTAVSDAIAVGDVKTAASLIRLVADAPLGHVAQLQRALLLWLRATADVQPGPDDTVDQDFRSASTALREFGAPYYLARTLLDHASWLGRRDRAEEAEPLLTEAAALFSQLGATPWVQSAEETRSLSVH